MDETRTLALLDELAEGLGELAELLERADGMLERGADRDAAREVIQRAVGGVRALVGRVQTVVRELRGPEVAERPLGEAIELLVKSSLPEGTEFDCETSTIEEPPAGEVREALLAVARDAVRHFTGYGDADRIRVTVESQPDALQLTISDRGSGFAPHELGEETGALAGIRETLREVGGDLGLETSWREGSRIVATVPRLSTRDSVR